MSVKWSASVTPNLARAIGEANSRGHAHIDPEHLIWVDLKDAGSRTLKGAVGGRPTQREAQDFVDNRLNALPKRPLGERQTPTYSERTREIIRAAVAESGTAQEEMEWSALIGGILNHPTDPCSVALRDELRLVGKGGEIDPETGKQRVPAGSPPPIPTGDALASFCRDLTALAAQGKIEPVIGRETEVEQVVTILAQKVINNPVLLGEPGVGKTAIIEGLALRVHQNNAGVLNGKRILSLDLGAMLAGASYRGEFEDRLKKVIDAIVAGQGQIILFVDEIHTLMGAGKSGESVDAANLLKPPLARGQLRLIGATTFGEYRQYLEKDAAFTRRFQRVTIPEPTPKQTIGILMGVRKRFEEYHGVAYSDEIIHKIVELAKRYIGQSQFPDRALRVLDRLGARAAVKRKPGADKGAGKVAADVLTIEDTASVVSELADVPLSRVLQNDSRVVESVQTKLTERVIGQAPAIERLAQRLRLALSPYRGGNRPRAAFHLWGPAGSGKSLAAGLVAKELFPGDKQFLEIDMSSFSSEHSESRLLGPPPGYVGFEAGGMLTEAAWRTPCMCILLDQVQNAHDKVMQVFAQLLDQGTVRDGKGKLVSFSECVFFLTSRDKNLPVSLAGRIDESIEFTAVGSAGAPEIAARLLREFAGSLPDFAEAADGGAAAPLFDLSAAARGALESRFDPLLGGWSVKNEVERDIVDAILRSGCDLRKHPGKVLKIDFSDGRYTFGTL